MKHVLGKLLLTAILVSATWAAPYQWRVSSAKTAAHVNEAVTVTYTCRFEDAGYNYVIDFYPPKETDDYRMHILHEQEQIVDGKRFNEYSFVVFPKRAGNVPLAFEALMRRTTKESIENTVIGRDNMEDFDFTDTSVALPVVSLDVEATDTALSGEFTLDMAIDKDAAQAFEPVHVTLSVSGYGNFEELTPFEVALDGVEVFTETPEQDYTLEKEGFKGRYIQRFALVSDKRFTLPAFTLDYFNTASKTRQQLTTEARTIEVAAPYSKEELLDEPGEEAKTFQWQWSYLNYPLLFLAGIGVGRWFRIRRKEKKVSEPWREHVNAVKDVKSLTMLLVLTDAHRYEELIRKFEKGGEAYGLSKAKKEVLRLS